MAFDQTVTAVAAVSSVAASNPINVNPQNRLSPVLVIAATSVTTGATVQIEGADIGVNGALGSYRTLGDPVAIAANGNTVVPLKKIQGSKMPDKVRINVTARTDGTYTTSLVETAG